MREGILSWVYFGARYYGQLIAVRASRRSRECWNAVRSLVPLYQGRWEMEIIAFAGPTKFYVRSGRDENSFDTKQKKRWNVTVSR